MLPCFRRHAAFIAFNVMLAIFSAGCGDSGDGQPPPNPFLLSNVEAGVGGFLFSGVPGDVSVAEEDVAGGGDVNGDGLDDVVVSSANSPGQAFVVFGKSDTTPVFTTDLDGTAGGFPIISGGPNAELYQVAMAGDVNGDGLDDVVIGAPLADFLGVDAAGQVFVVFGKITATAVDVADVANGIGGFMISGTATIPDVGQDVDGAGDVNGDGLDDIVIGVRGLIPPHPSGCLVVFGKTSTGALSADDLASGVGGFPILNSTNTQVGVGPEVSGAGDVNADGLDDVIVNGGQLMGDGSGGALVIFGKTSNTPVNPDDIGAGIGGFAIFGTIDLEGAGAQVSEAGDVNGDGFGDVLVSSIFAVSTGIGFDFPGGVHIVFGNPLTTPILLSDVREGRSGIFITGSKGQDGMNYVGAAGDVNDDGFADVIVGAPNQALGNGLPGGVTYVVFGSPDPGVIDVRNVAARRGGYAFAAGPAVENAGRSVSTAGDVNGDGINDLLIGARSGSESAGRAYIVFLPPDNSL